jgi:hypothetical protein
MAPHTRIVNEERLFERIMLKLASFCGGEINIPRGRAARNAFLTRTDHGNRCDNSVCDLTIPSWDAGVPERGRTREPS